MANGQVPMVAVIDERTVLQGPDINVIVAALQQQVDRDFVPQWGQGANLQLVPANTNPPDGSWWLVIQDYTGDSSLGYHYVTSDGLPMGIVGAVSSGDNWSITASHELLEMLGDPYVSTCIFDPELAYNIPQEVCDPCEADAYNIDSADPNSVLVSDFVFPSWFGLNGGGGGAYDQLNLTPGPFQLSPDGGHIDPSGCSQGQALKIRYDPGLGLPLTLRAGLSERRLKRAVPRNQWIRSDIDRRLPLNQRLAQNRMPYRIHHRRP